MNLQSLAHALGGEVSGGQVIAPGPGHSPKDRSMAVRLDHQAPEGFIAFSHAGDDFRACRDHIKQRLGLSMSAISRTSGTSMSGKPAAACSRPGNDDRTARAMALWNESVSPHDTLVETYLTGRGLPLPADAAGEAIRFHPECPFRLDDGKVVTLPTMLCLMRNVHTDAPQAVHRTALGPNGDGKATVVGLGNPKKMLGPSRQAAIKFGPDEEVLDGIGLTEGIETALAIMGIGWRPVWACGSAGSISSFPVLNGVSSITLFADADPTGLAAAQSCQARWLAADRECVTILPPSDDQDWADVVGMP